MAFIYNICNRFGGKNVHKKGFHHCPFLLIFLRTTQSIFLKVVHNCLNFSYPDRWNLPRSRKYHVIHSRACVSALVKIYDVGCTRYKNFRSNTPLIGFTAEVGHYGVTSKRNLYLFNEPLQISFQYQCCTLPAPDLQNLYLFPH